MCLGSTEGGHAPRSACWYCAAGAWPPLALGSKPIHDRLLINLVSVARQGSNRAVNLSQTPSCSVTNRLFLSKHAYDRVYTPVAARRVIIRITNIGYIAGPSRYWYFSLWRAARRLEYIWGVPIDPLRSNRYGDFSLRHGAPPLNFKRFMILME